MSARCWRISTLFNVYGELLRITAKPPCVYLWLPCEKNWVTAVRRWYKHISVLGIVWWNYSFRKQYKADTLFDDLYRLQWLQKQLNWFFLKKKRAMPSTHGGHCPFPYAVIIWVWISYIIVAPSLKPTDFVNNTWHIDRNIEQHRFKQHRTNNRISTEKCWLWQRCQLHTIRCIENSQVYYQFNWWN